MTAKTLVRVVVVALAGASVVTAVAVTGRMAEEPGRAPEMPAGPAGDPLARELARCKRLRLAEADDAACRAVWAKNQDRFFGSSRSTEVPTGSVRPETSVRSPGSPGDEPSPLAPNAEPRRPASHGAVD
ncbi:putative entry exclusion protein TrbK-alt [Rhodoplanes serenus]|uniref:Entry exclusion protein TrbK-alt n=1 Tax=Rhodoplanes serenus TaxID=200615 RepID=A0A9X5AUC0_9BRAD|nr:putative entry exclusion protein TrbK-alt [Rhodoplanes serenus]MTW19321.1 putative entry exclusion protein TrbK-alt [Rhodoplanes serenus]